MGFTGDSGNFLFGAGNNDGGADKPDKHDAPKSSQRRHSRSHSHKRHSSISTRKDSMQLMSGSSLANDADDHSSPSPLSPSSPPSPESSLSSQAIHNGFVSPPESSLPSGFVVMPTTAQLDELSDSDSMSAGTPQSTPTQRRPSPMSISQLPSLGALMEEEEDDDEGTSRTRASFKSYRTKRNSVDLDSLMRGGNISNAPPQRSVRPLSMHNPPTKSPFNYTTKVSQPPNFQRSTSTSSELSNSQFHSQSSINTSVSSPLTTVSFGKSADFDYGGMPPVPSSASATNNTTPPRRRGSIQYRRSDDNMDDLANLSGGSGGKSGVKPLNLVNKARSGSNSSNTSTETTDLFTTSPSSRAFLEQQLSNTLEDLSVYRDKNATLEKELQQERKERQSSEERVKRLGDKLNQLPNPHEYKVQMEMMNQLRDQVYYLTGELEGCKNVVHSAQTEIGELKELVRQERDLRRDVERVVEEQQHHHHEYRYQQEQDAHLQAQQQAHGDTQTYTHTRDEDNSHHDEYEDEQDQEKERPVRPHSLLIDWRFPINSLANSLDPRIEEEEEELKQPTHEDVDANADDVDYRDAFAHTSSKSFGKEGSIDDDSFGLPPINTPPGQVASNSNTSESSYGFFRSRSNSLLNKARISFSPSPNRGGVRYVDKERQLERLGGARKSIDFSHAYAQAGYSLSDV
ncbi:hypothetical protein E3P99_01754 [Wallemia hederae]|uniref:Uncharacterized protein n=1 Tax=Wallemia hederae TaxID=1540922 RepID=A0A4V4LTE8_9BASI|nr:hypothetical protein E3P99_01754 [Wallemia hederae]